MKTILLLVMLVYGLGNGLHAAPDKPAATPVAPFWIVFKAYDGDPQMTNNYKKFSYQIGAIDLRQPSDFLNLGNIIPGTRLKLLKFVFKEAYNETLKEKEDVSEITVINPANGKTAVLPLNKPVDVSALDPVSSKTTK